VIFAAFSPVHFQPFAASTSIFGVIGVTHKTPFAATCTESNPTLSFSFPTQGKT